jgi:ubiquinone/menaquinone biosynthesis C-methylase UbiE/DNA-binding transcriptional ArsR family regulator
MSLWDNRHKLKTMEILLTALKAIAEPTRLRLLVLLEHNELTVTELTQILAQSQPRVSRHLKLMSEAGLIDRFSEGTWAFYRVAEGTSVAPLIQQLVDLLPEDDPTLSRDLERLEQVKASRAEVATDYFRENARRWDEIRSLYSSEAEVEAAIMHLLGDQPIDTLLDIGTGTGRMLSLFSPQIDKGIGIDMSREMLSVARANMDQDNIPNCQVRQGNMYNLYLPNGSVDLAIFHHVLHFADDPAAAVAEAARVTTPEGRMIIVDFAPHDLEYLRADHAHRRLGFQDEEVANWCRAAGFGSVTCRHLEGGELTVTIWLIERQAGDQPRLKIVEGSKS